MTLLSYLLGLCILFPQIHGTTKIDNLSWKAPFNSHDHRGTRVITGWSVGGQAVLKQSFVRITSDRPWQEGFAWSRATIDQNEFSGMVKLRVSGTRPQESQDYEGADSIAIYFTTEDKFEAGRVHGFKENFVGIGMVIDSLPPDPSATVPKNNINMVANNGRMTYDQVLSFQTGCSLDVRYHEDRDDFNILRASRIRFRYREVSETMELEVDSKNSGRWQKCATLDLRSFHMPVGWARKAHIGIVGRTGQWSDNHDILSFSTYSSPEEAWQVDTIVEDESLDDYMLLVAHMEHELYEVHSSLESTIASLRAQEQEAEDRIRDLEEMLSRNVLEKLDSRLAQLERRVHGNVHQVVGSRLESLHASVHDSFKTSLEKRVDGAKYSWRLPFLLLVALLLGVMFMAYRQYNDIKKAS